MLIKIFQFYILCKIWSFLRIHEVMYRLVHEVMYRSQDCLTYWKLLRNSLFVSWEIPSLPWNAIKIHLALKQNQFSKWVFINRFHCPLAAVYLSNKDKCFSFITIKIFHFKWLESYFPINYDLYWLLWHEFVVLWCRLCMLLQWKPWQLKWQITSAND